MRFLAAMKREHVTHGDWASSESFCGIPFHHVTMVWRIEPGMRCGKAWLFFQFPKQILKEMEYSDNWDARANHAPSRALSWPPSPC